MGKRRVSAVTLIVLVVATVPMVQRFLQDDEPRLVDIGYPERLAIRPSVIASGKLAHAQTVQLSAQVIGRVKAVM